LHLSFIIIGLFLKNNLSATKQKRKVKPRLKISPRRIHVADDVTNIAHNCRKYKDSKEKHTSSEDVLLHVVTEKGNQIHFESNKPLEKKI